MRVKYSENKPINEGFYLARLDGLEETSHPQYGKSIKWTFTILEPEAEANTTVTAMSSLKVTPKSKLFSWLQAFGVILGDNDDFEMDNLLGKMVKVRIKNTTKVSVVDGQERSVTYSNVNALAAYIPQEAAAPPVQAASTQTPPAQTPPAQTPPAQTSPAQAPPAQTSPAQTSPNVVQRQNLADDEEFDF